MIHTSQRLLLTGFAITMLVGCSTDSMKASSQSSGLPTQGNSTDLTQSILSLNNQELSGFVSPENNQDDLSGTSATGLTQLTSHSFVTGWNLQKYLLAAVDNSAPIQVEYQTLSGGPAIPTVLAWNNGWTNLGLKYNAADLTRFKGTVTIPANTSYVAVVFYGFKTGSLNATVSQPAIMDTPHDPPPDPQNPATLITQAVQRAGGKLGSSQGELGRASTVNAWKQEFSNGIALLEDGDSQAYAIYGKIWEKFKTDGNTTRFGLPLSDITTGVTLNGKVSEYQLYDKPGSPSLHSSALGTFLFLGGIRDLWQKYRDQLGHPISDEVNGTQNFERGKIEWNNGNPRVTVNGQVILGSVNSGAENSCWAYPVGNPPGSGQEFNNNANPFQALYKGKYHLGDDWNGNGGGNTDDGLPVYAIGNGIVLEAKNLGKGWGNAVFVKHLLNGKEYTAMYAHLKQIQVKKDQVIGIRQQLGTIGRGYNNEYIAHLHLEIRQGISLRSGPGYTSSKLNPGPQSQVSPQTLINQNRCR